VDLNLKRIVCWGALRNCFVGMGRGPWASRRQARWLAALLVVILALVPRLILLLELSDAAPTFDAPEGGDSRFYDRIAAGGPAPQRAYFHSPLYRWFLSALYQLFGRDLFAVRAVQLLLGVVTAGLIYWLTLRVFRRLSVATLAGAIAALLGPAMFYEGQLLVDGLIPLLAILVLHLLLDALRRPSASAYASVGLMLGIAALGRAVILLWLPLLIWFVATTRTEGRTRFRYLGGLLVGVALAILPVTLRNIVMEDDVVVITANAGLNLYVGNNPKANGGYALPEGLWFRPGDPLDDFAGFAAASQALGHEPSSSELSRWWTAKAWSFVVNHPLQALNLVKEKLRILVNDYEYPQMVNYQVYGEVAPVLTVLPRAGLVVPAGLVGLAAMWVGRHGRRRRLLAGLVVSYGLAFLPFFVTGRYRVAWLVLLSPFAAWAVIRLVLAARRQRWRRAAGLTLAAALAAVLSFVPLRAYPSRANQHLAFARAELQAKDPAGAAHWARRATEVEPTAAEPWAVRGQALRLEGQSAAAIELLAPKAATHSEAASIHRELGAALLEVGRAAEAAAALDQCINLQPGDAEAWLLFGRAMEDLACWQRALEAYRAVLGFVPGSSAAQRAQQRLASLKGQGVGDEPGAVDPSSPCSW